MRRARWLVRLVVTLALIVFAFVYRFVDPEGSFAGLTDDHFFYVVRGWQILFGQLPVRDFVDPGAPLTFLLSAAAQLVDRGTVSEMVLCAVSLAIGAGLTCWAAILVSDSLLVGLASGLFQVAMMARYYNHPKILVYAVAIPLLWAYATRQTRGRLVAIAVTTAVAFLLRHDHGVFVAIAMATLLLALRAPSLATRLRHAAAYGALVLALLTPYFLYLTLNGGILFHARTAMSWSERDRDRAPLILPGFTMPAFAQANSIPWTFYTIEILPVLALLMLLRTPSAFRPDWPEARAKVAMLAVLAIVLNVGFIRGSLNARFADVSVPQAILGAWLLLGCYRLLVQGRWESGRPAAWAIRYALPAVIISMMVGVMAGRTEALSAHDAPLTLGRLRYTFDRYRPLWPLSRWANPDSPETMVLAMYLEQCTEPTDFIFMSPYLPQVVALANRPFAGGHGDLRPDFFNTEEHQRLTVARLESQRVPVAFIATENAEGFPTSFPIVSTYMRQRFEALGTRQLADGLKVDVFVDRSRTPVGTYAPLDLPCYR
ncbi:MAG: hypothetical protein ABL986_03850 [Vicinamibacterales bacterium]